VDVVVAAVEAVGHRVDPADQLDLDPRLALGGDDHLAFDLPVLGAAAKDHGELARCQEHRATVGAVDLLLEEEIGRQPAGLGRVNVFLLVLDGVEGEAADGRLAVEGTSRRIRRTTDHATPRV